jgi:hypothetical protein
LGDVNQGGEVNGLDVDSFVEVLLSGPDQAEADMSWDQVVNGTHSHRRWLRYRTQAVHGFEFALCRIVARSSRRFDTGVEPCGCALLSAHLAMSLIEWRSFPLISTLIGSARTTILLRFESTLANKSIASCRSAVWPEYSK